MTANQEQAPAKKFSATGNMRLQHQTLLATCLELENLTIQQSLSLDAALTAQILQRLTGQLKAHLAMEDQAMYPNLISNKDQSVSQLARQYQMEMGGLSAAYMDFATKWNAKTIEENNCQFAEDTTKVLAALRDRIKREDTELYELVDRL